MTLSSDGEGTPINPAKMKAYIKACRDIYFGLKYSLSIDNFIHSRAGEKEIEQVAKLAIVKCILDAERKSFLNNKPDASFVSAFHDPELYIRDRELVKRKESWIFKFIRLLTEGVKWQEIPNRLIDINFVIFNYDRCVEHIIIKAISELYGRTQKESTEHLKGFLEFSIFHPYGVVGKLPHLSSRLGDSSSFGEEIENPQKLISLSSSIKTFTQSVDEMEFKRFSLPSKFQKTSKLVFLGFAYNSQNLDLLKQVFNQQQSKGTDVIGTAYGISEYDLSTIKQRIINSLRIKPQGSIDGGNWKLDNCSCSELFDGSITSLSFK